MGLTRNFDETVRSRAQRDPKFREALLKEAIEAMVGGEVELSKALLRDYINATVGFKSVGTAINKSPKSIMRMLSRDGNPNVNNLFSVTRFLQEDAGVKFKVVSAKAKRTKMNVEV